ncbi:MAG: type IV toxin-antitoxin system AbiEi family antitoxin domain-containing protein [Prevotella sp.]|nr:type IV toxin-antitoxin system AbiEi family antitoxin domain-containing protein [Prevotella sp.]
MTIANQIIDIATKQNGIFTRKDILNGLCCDTNKISKGSVAVMLERMMAEDKIVRIAHGTYKINKKMNKEFFYKPNDFMLLLNSHIKQKFPFIDYCIWQSSVLTPMMQHVPAVNMTLVDVERVAMESVFMALQSVKLNMPILLNPTKDDCDRYIGNNETIIIRPLVKEAPIKIIDDCPTPMLEKMLVDAVADKELQHLQGNELFTIYSNAFSDYRIKQTRLLRYASRRNRKDKVLQILKAIQI